MCKLVFSDLLIIENNQPLLTLNNNFQSVSMWINIKYDFQWLNLSFDNSLEICDFYWQYAKEDLEIISKKNLKIVRGQICHRCFKTGA